MCTWGWHITHCLQPLFTEAHCTRSWLCKAAQPPAFPHQHLPAFPPAAACSWNCPMQKHDALCHARAGPLFTTSFSLLSWEHDQLYGLFPELLFFLLSCLPRSRFKHHWWSQWGISSGPQFLSLMALGWFCCGLRVSSKASSNLHIHGDLHSAQLPECWNYTGNQATVAGWALDDVWGKDQTQEEQPCSPPLRLPKFWLHEDCQGEGINNLPEEKEALVNSCSTP